jgi:hypothetical protein
VIRTPRNLGKKGMLHRIAAPSIKRDAWWALFSDDAAFPFNLSSLDLIGATAQIAVLRCVVFGPAAQGSGAIAN